MKNPGGTKAGRKDKTPTPLPRKRRLKTAQDLRIFLADTVNRANRGELDTATARTLGYLAQVMSGIIQVGDVEKRLEALEAQAKETSK